MLDVYSAVYVCMRGGLVKGGDSRLVSSLSRSPFSRILPPYFIFFPQFQLVISGTHMKDTGGGTNGQTDRRTSS